MKKITVVGSLNIDHVLKVNDLPAKGETLSSNSYELKCGGKGANQAVAIGRLGLDIAMIGKVGDDESGKMQMESLSGAGVETGGIITAGQEKTGAAFITVDSGGNNTIVLYPGANGNLAVKDLESKKKYLLESDIVVLQMEIPTETNCHIIDFAYKNNKLIILNLAPAMDLDRQVLKKIDYLIVNEVEVRYLTGIEFEVERAEDSMIKLRKFFKNNALVTLGEEGTVLLTDSGKIFHYPAFPVDPVDSTAAGDAFTGGFIMGLVEGKNIGECIILGNGAGAISVTRPGAQPSLANREELSNFLSSRASG